jgi:hypothetical protein
MVTLGTILGITGFLGFVHRMDPLESTSGCSNHGDSVTCGHNEYCNHDDSVNSVL